MIFLLLVVFTVVICSIPVALGAVVIGWPVRVLLRVVQDRRDDPESSEDWWPAFERDFRHYTSSAWVSAREEEDRG